MGIGEEADIIKQALMPLCWNNAYTSR